MTNLGQSTHTKISDEYADIKLLEWFGKVMTKSKFPLITFSVPKE